MTQLALAMPDRAQGPLRRPPEPIVREACFSQDGRCRYLLKRTWGTGLILAIAGLNPSHADGARDDPTMVREMGFAYRWGFAGLVKLNIYPFIASQPAAMRRWRAERSNQAFGERFNNLMIAGGAVARADFHLAAWGAGAEEGHVDLFLEEMRRMGRRLGGRAVVWHCLGTNDDGSPRHTLARGRNRIPDDARPELWRRAA